MPKWSIVTPCYNAAAYIGATVASVRAQTEGDWEHIVIDDGSGDGSADVVAGLCESDPRLRLVTQANRGCAATRNAGFRATASDSRYLWFLDADDTLEPTALATVGAYLDAHPGVGMTHCGFAFIGGDGSPVPAEETGMTWAKRTVPTRWGLRTLADSEPETPFPAVFVLAGIIPSLAAFRRDVYQTTSGWDEDLGLIYEDVSLYLEMALRAPVHFLPAALAHYRVHNTQVSVHSDRFFQQEQKLYAKWYSKTDLRPDWQARLNAAKAFRDGRYLARMGWQAGVREIKQGRVGAAGRFWGGAARRYAASLAHAGAFNAPSTMLSSLTAAPETTR